MRIVNFVVISSIGGLQQNEFLMWNISNPFRGTVTLRISIQLLNLLGGENDVISGFCVLFSCFLSRRLLLLIDLNVQ